VYPAAQVHTYELAASLQDPPFKQGEEAHSSTSFSQSLPPKPPEHVHVYLSTGTPLLTLDSTQDAPFMQGEDSHSLMSMSQLPVPAQLLQDSEQ